MARPLSFAMDQINKGETEERRPVYQILIYDLRTSGQTIRDIVVGNPLDALTGPLDITEFVETCKIDEKAGTYAGAGVTATSITLAINDSDGIFDPLLVRTDPTIDGRFFRSGNVVRIIEGDLQTPIGDRVITFTGPVLGQVGYDRN